MDSIIAEDQVAVEAAIKALREINDGDDDKAINARSVALIQAAANLGEDLHDAKEAEGKGDGVKDKD